MLRLEYEAYAPLVAKEGERIVAEALARFDARAALGVHRQGLLEIGDCAVWVGVSAPHRDAAFAACRYLIDEAKRRLPIWKGSRTCCPRGPAFFTPLRCSSTGGYSSPLFWRSEPSRC